jgi:hypothetical protein
MTESHGVHLTSAVDGADSFSSKHAPGPWKVFQMTGHKNVFFVRRDIKGGHEFLQTPSGFPRVFRSLGKARAAIAAATGEQP